MSAFESLDQGCPRSKIEISEILPVSDEGVLGVLFRHTHLFELDHVPFGLDWYGNVLSCGYEGEISLVLISDVFGKPGSYRTGRYMRELFDSVWVLAMTNGATKPYDKCDIETDLQ